MRGVGLVVYCVFALLFLVLGRWLHRHPERVAPEWLSSNSSGVQTAGRVFGLTMMYIGSYGLVFGVSSFLLPESAAYFLSLLGAAFVTYLLPLEQAAGSVKGT